MKKIISLIIGAVMLCTINGIGNAFTSDIPTFEDDQVVSNTVEKVQEDEKIVEESDLSNEQSTEEPEEVKEEKNSSSETEKSKVIVSEQSTITEEPKTIEQPKVVAENEKQNNVQKNEQPTHNVEVKANNPWDNLGITEYQYYNTPAHKWAELDFKSSVYGNQEQTLNACKEYGNAHIKENGGGYFCISINSYSGDYLGEDIDFY